MFTLVCELEKKMLIVRCHSISEERMYNRRINIYFSYTVTDGNVEEKKYFSVKTCWL
jgi:hypothetical protein